MCHLISREKTGIPPEFNFHLQRQPRQNQFIAKIRLFAFDLHSEFAYKRIVAAEENLTSHMYAVDCLVEKHPLRGWSSNNHIAIVNCIHRLRIFTIPVALCYPARRARVFQLIDHSASKIPKHHSVRMHRCVVVVAPARGAFNFYAQTVDIFVF